MTKQEKTVIDRFDDYQREAGKYASYPEKHALTYPFIGLANETGEALGKLKKIMRGDSPKPTTEELADELGDVLWYLSACATACGYTLKEVAGMNLKKLARRFKNGTVKGSGDKR